MDDELTWDQEQDNQDYEQWAAEQAWEECMQREAQQFAEMAEPSMDNFIPYLFHWHNSSNDTGYSITEQPCP